MVELETTIVLATMTDVVETYDEDPHLHCLGPTQDYLEPTQHMRVLGPS